MENFKIYPLCLTTGNKAPFMYEEANDKKEALEQARKRSGLSRFRNWYFRVEKI